MVRISAMLMAAWISGGSVLAADLPAPIGESPVYGENRGDCVSQYQHARLTGTVATEPEGETQGEKNQSSQGTEINGDRLCGFTTVEPD